MKRMKILITGASGLVGKALASVLETAGHEVHKLGRKAPRGDREIQWDSSGGFAADQLAKLEAFDAVVHLAGDNIASENWSAAKKKLIRSSRVDGTRVLVDSLKTLENPPKTFISASASGFYGDRGDEILDENSTPGTGFLPDTCREWEAAAEKASEFGARVVKLRIGVVLAKEGGALEKMLTPFKFGVGGVLGSGRQWMPWIALDDLISIIRFALEREDIEGAVNAVAPEAVTNETFTKTFGRVLNRPTFIPVPEFGIKLLFGEMGETLLLQGQRMTPAKLIDSKFEFEFPDLESALRRALV